MRDVEQSSARLPRAARIAAWCGVAVGLGTVGLYRVVLDAQGDADSGTAAWTAIMLAPCALAFVATLTGPRRASVLFGASAVLFGGLGLLAIFSIGLGFLLAAALVLAAALIALSVRSGA